MSEYIKKEDAIASARALLFCYGSDNIPDDKLDEYAEEFINDDDNTIVEVVRCKDCIHNDQCKHRVVMWVEDPINTWHKDIDFCSYGERKDNE